ncbi:hypothetical protein [Dyella acidiphila]|uniref:Uncharacterized protein n=1 Tax=Dyella acidiphila TaxID=2775866 RepID=A0ABR9GCN0_9GAMM|nr:hypothetical protein [Dyella acidiphila]MBE1161794.1 hypothetical protein [Dyella acidiphila]
MTEMAPRPFNFSWLEEKIAEYAADMDDPPATKIEGYGMIAVVVIGGLAILFHLLLRNQLGLYIFQLSVLLQWLCVVAVYVRTGYRAWRAYKRQYIDIAHDLDNGYVRYREIIDGLRTYPAAEIAKHLRYIRDRKAVLMYRHGLLSGGMEKIGVLPLVALLYLQLKDWSFGDWKGLLAHFHWIGSILLSLLIVTYAISWWVVRTKGRLDAYETVLTEVGVAEAEQATPAL